MNPQESSCGVCATTLAIELLPRYVGYCFGSYRRKHTARSERWFADHSESPKLISWWVDVEWSAAISMKVKTGALDQNGRALVDGAFRQLIDASFTSIPVEHSHFIAAGEFARRSTGLRAGDALHLAIADSQKCRRLYARCGHGARGGGAWPACVPDMIFGWRQSNRRETRRVRRESL